MFSYECTHTTDTIQEKRKNYEEYVKYGFEIIEDDYRTFVCVVVLPTDYMKPFLLMRQLETKHPTYTNKEIH